MNSLNSGSGHAWLGPVTMTGGTVSGTYFKSDGGITTLASTAEALVSVATLSLGATSASNTFNVSAGSVANGVDLLVTSTIINEVDTGTTYPLSLTKMGAGVMAIASAPTVHRAQRPRSRPALADRQRGACYLIHVDRYGRQRDPRSSKTPPPCPTAS